MDSPNARTVASAGVRTAALVLASFGSGGAERVVLNLARGLQDAGARVRLLVVDARGPLRTAVPDGVDVVDLAAGRVRRAGRRLVGELRARPADLVIASQTHVNVLLGLLRPALPAGSRLVVREPNLRPEADPSRPADRAVGWALGRADLVVASSEPMQDHLSAVVAGRAPVVVLPNPVDVAGLRAAARAGEPLAPAARLVSVGRLAPQKAHVDLLAAVASAPGAPSLTVLGDGPLRDTLEAQVERAGLGGSVRLAGRVDDHATLTATVAAADLMVHPATFDGMPNAVLEALAVGTPVLATTDLTVLADLAAEVGPDALRLVPRGRLTDALTTAAATEPDPAPRPRPSLLPDRFAVDAVVTALLDTLDGRVASGS